jgi:triosephosphate isomerase
MAREAGAELVLVGHSERRHIFGETNVEVGRKTALACSLGLTPVLCVGETLSQREMGDAERVVVEQLQVGIDQLPKAKVPEIIIAYEPVWAIGTGRSATPQDASAMHRVVRTTLRECAGGETDIVPILYGGSVSRANAKSLLDAHGVDGVLVGSSCLDPEGWAEICRT